jgi:site-specific DNA-methyltransferase (adenine-specific)
MKYDLNQIILADCMDIMRDIPDKYFELAIVDPPYGIGVNISMGRRHGDLKSDYHKFYGHDKSIPDKIYFTELSRVSDNQIVWGGNYMTEFLPPSPCWVLWDKGFSPDVTFAQFEMAWSSFRSSTKKFNFNAASNNNRIHPTQKPVALYRWLLQKYANPGDKIIDTHSGSGSCAIACHIEKHDFLAIEKDADYHAASVKRLEEVRAQGVLF